MRILIISYYFSPDTTVAADRAYGFAQSLASAGHQVTVLTSAPESNFSADFNVVNIPNKFFVLIKKFFSFFSEEVQTNKGTTKSQTTSFFSGIINRFNQFRKSKGILFLGRMPDLADFWYLSAFNWIKQQPKWDVVMASYAPYSNLLLALKTKKQNLANYFIADFRDPWIDHHLFSGLPLISMMELRLFKKICNNTDHITTATPTLSKLINKQSGQHCITILNGAVVLKSSAPSLPFSLPSDELLIIHTGSIYTHMQSIDPFFTALKDLKATHTFKVCFAGNEKEHIQSLISKYQLENHVYHLGFLNKSNCRHLIEIADICLSFDLNNQSFPGIIPVKLIEYMAHNKNILFCYEHIDSDAASMLEKYNNKETTPYNTRDLTRALNRLYQTSSLTTKNMQYFRDYQNIDLVDLISNLNKNTKNENSPRSK
ncbi:glycosyltransferase [Pseudoalteromonas sp. C2R02]|uniref:glycosyltransferase n=1 Tax=Pseudoalteromonas sp. C2R02 TaxID=2841565 RepID=UPI001C08519D|nr:glycosyltransferase [Pseudoalteromonas sp. C2R02]MBU2971739.1 glycosyltransferase [Pseudoalteromonas sp. C2R02]